MSFAVTSELIGASRKNHASCLKYATNCRFLPILKKGKFQPDSSLRDTENVPLKEDIKEYFDLEVKFNVMIADVNKIIAEAIKDVLWGRKWNISLL